VPAGFRGRTAIRRLTARDEGEGLICKLSPQQLFE